MKLFTQLACVVASLGLGAQQAQAAPLDPVSTVIEVRSVHMKFTAQDGDDDSVLTVYPDHAEADRRVDGEPGHEERTLPPGLWSVVLDRVQKIDQHGGRLAQPADARHFVVTVKQNGAVVKDYDSRISVNMDQFIETEISDPIWALFAR